MSFEVSKTSNIQSVNSVKKPNASSKSDNNSIWYVGKHKFDGVVDATNQSKKYGNCWFLTTINALRITNWGSEAINEAIKPDGNGGVAVTLNLPDGSQKAIAFSKSEVDKASASGNYSDGDPDMLVLEMAFEKYFKETFGMNLHAGTPAESSMVARLLCKDVENTYILGDCDEADLAFEEILKKPDEYAIYCSFKTINACSNGTMLFSGHAYSIHSFEKDENGEVIALVSDPRKSEAFLKIPLEDLKANLFHLNIMHKSSSGENKLKTNEYSQKHFEALQKSLLLSQLAAKGDKAGVKSLINSLTTENISAFIGSFDEPVVLIKILDGLEFGWGNGNAKKELIKPIIDKLCDRAKELDVSQEYIEEIKSRCYTELDAMFYTDEKVIGEEIARLLNIVSSIEYKDI